MNSHRSFAVLFGSLFIGNCFAAPQTREECRTSTTQGEVVACIEAKLYDPCDDSGGSWGGAQCAWAHAEIADRRVNKAEREIVSRLKQGKSEQATLKQFRQVQRDWQAYRKSYCTFTNMTVDLQAFNATSFHHAGFCYRRTTEQRAAELEAVVQGHE